MSLDLDIFRVVSQSSGVRKMCTSNNFFFFFLETGVVRGRGGRTEN